jgi:hypothetical protein
VITFDLIVNIHEMTISYAVYSKAILLASLVLKLQIQEISFHVFLVYRSQHWYSYQLKLGIWSK